MKTRKGFVSNSSSSSFICDVCGKAEGGWDLTLEDAYMIECEKCNSIMCYDHVGEGSSVPDHKCEESDDGVQLKREFCPVCNMEVVTDADLGLYLYKKFATSRRAEVDEIKARFLTHDALNEYLRSTE